MGEIPRALTVSMYSDLFDLRATGAGLVDMVIFVTACCRSSCISCATCQSASFPRVVVTKNMASNIRRVVAFAA